MVWVYCLQSSCYPKSSWEQMFTQNCKIAVTVAAADYVQCHVQANICCQVVPLGNHLLAAREPC